MNGVEAIKQRAMAVVASRKKDAKTERNVRNYITEFESKLATGAKKARMEDSGRVHEPVEPYDYCCPFCDEELKGRKIGVMHGKGKIRAHEKCYIENVIYDPSGYLYSWYKSFGLYLSEHKEQTLFYMLGSMYNRTVDTMKAVKTASMVEEEIEIDEAEPVADDTDYLNEAHPSVEDTFYDLESRKDIAVTAYDEVEEFLKARIEFDTAEEMDDYIAVVNFLHTIRKMKLNTAHQKAMYMNDAEYNQILQAIGNNTVEAEPEDEDEAIQQVASSSHKAKLQEYISNDKRLKQMLSEYNAMK